MTDILKRLRGYNPPDRTVDEQRQIAQDISDAADEIERLSAPAPDVSEIMALVHKMCFRDPSPEFAKARIAVESALRAQAEEIERLRGLNCWNARQEIKPLEEVLGERKAVRLTDEQIKSVFREVFQVAAGPSGQEYARAIESSVLKANGIEI